MSLLYINVCFVDLKRAKALTFTSKSTHTKLSI